MSSTKQAALPVAIVDAAAHQRDGRAKQRMPVVVDTIPLVVGKSDSVTLSNASGRRADGWRVNGNPMDRDYYMVQANDSREVSVPPFGEAGHRYSLHLSDRDSSRGLSFAMTRKTAQALGIEVSAT